MVPFFAEMNTMDTMDFACAFSGPISGTPHNSLGWVQFCHYM